jgi:hypothetical protein
MSSRTTLNKSDEGKQIVDSEGDTIGMVSEVEGSVAHINPEPDISGQIRSKLGWENMDQDTHVLKEHSIKTITDEEIHLK